MSCVWRKLVFLADITAAAAGITLGNELYQPDYIFQGRIRFHLTQAVYTSTSVAMAMICTSMMPFLTSSATEMIPLHTVHALYML